ncbi:neurturin isoform X1 [Nerophis ophidion]|uniref:neurturin isoform X1 n=2 Tax=Nerophis ophidion TaxID=159077 RepID=UPI002ADF143E|nr:neurturin isoform X1 [Nerophis ophidion]
MKASMIGGTGKVSADRQRWWRHKASDGQHHLRNWKVMLWLVAALLALVEDALSEEDVPEGNLDLQGVLVLGQPSWPPQDEVDPLWPESLEEWTLLQEEDAPHQSRWRRFPHNADLSSTSRRKRKRTKSSPDCRLEKRQMRVRDLGLGFDSDEIVLFKYCVGSCHGARGNYDLALKALVAQGSVSGRKVSSQPCCRPSRYETVSFMDAHTMWQTIRWLSAADCSCVG